MELKVGIVASFLLVSRLLFSLLRAPIKLAKLSISKNRSDWSEYYPNSEFLAAASVIILALANASMAKHGELHHDGFDIMADFGVEGTFAQASLLSLISCFVATIFLSALWLLICWKPMHRGFAEIAGRLSFVVVFGYSLAEFAKVVGLRAVKQDSQISLPEFLFWPLIGLATWLLVAIVVFFIATLINGRRSITINPPQQETNNSNKKKN